MKLAQTFKELLSSLEITKIKSNASADAVLEEAKKAGVEVPELSTHKEKLEFIKMMIVGEVEVPEGSSYKTNGATIDVTQNIVLKKYLITGEIFPLNEDGTPQEEALEIGSVQEVPQIIGDGWIEDGLAELAKPVVSKSEQRRVAAQKKAEEADVQVQAPKTYLGSIVVSESVQLLHGKTYNQVVCANGQTFLLTKEEYKEQVI